MAIVDLIQANDCLIDVDMGSGYVPFLCVKSFTVNIVTDEKEITTEGDGFFKAFDYKILSWTVNINGAMQLQDNVNPVIFDLVEYQKNFIEVPLRVRYYKGTQLKVFTGRCIVKQSNISNNASQLADGTADLLGSGSFTLEDSLPDQVNLNLIMTGSDSSVALAKFRLINSDGEIIFQSDTLPEANGGWLSNPFNVNALVPKGSWYVFWITDCQVDNNNFSLDAPPTLSTDFDNNVQQQNTYPSQLYDFTANRTGTWTLGIPVPPPACVPPVMGGGPAMPDGSVGAPYSYSKTLTGSQPFSLSDVTKPSWLNITVTGSTILMTGTPDVSGTDLPINFNVNNDCGTVFFEDTINVADTPTLSTISWTRNGLIFGGVLRIYQNGTLVVQATTLDSGSFVVNPGDTLQATLSGINTYTKHLIVTDSISGTLSNTSGTGTQSYSWVISNGHDYSVTGTIS